MIRITKFRRIGLCHGISALAVSVSASPAMAASLPHELTVSGMFMQADWIVKTVMIGLLLASIICWTLFVAKSLELKKEVGAMSRTVQTLHPLETLSDAQNDVHSKNFPFVIEASAEMALSKDSLSDAEGVKERILSRFDRYQAANNRIMMRGISLLATIGATAPFVGLFGTVWGIMNSFVGIAEKQTTNLAVVAPGIAEALLATALGLVAAIPAVVMYNHFSRQIAGYKARSDDAAALVMRMVSRDLSRLSVKG